MKIYTQTRSLFYAIETSAANNPAVMGFIEDLRKSLTGLVPENYIALYGRERMPDLARYIKAINLRAERGRSDIDKDRKKAANIKPFTDRLNETINSLEPTTSSEKREAIETFYWMIEEFKVSLFAQELKTAYPVSIKKLNHQVSRIHRMI